MKRLSFALACALAVISFAAAARADIYQWVYVQELASILPSSTPCPGGYGVYAYPGADLRNRDLTRAYLGTNSRFGIETDQSVRLGA